MISGGGVTLDLGIYAITMASLVFGGGKPESVQANGYLTDTGVDELTSVIIKYPGNLYYVIIKLILSTYACICRE